MKRIRLSKHAQEQAAERGTTRAEVEEAIRKVLLRLLRGRSAGFDAAEPGRASALFTLADDNLNGAAGFLL